MSKKFSPTGITPGDTIYLFFSPMIQDLEGKMLTFIDAFITDPVQRKATKDLIRPAIWSWAIEANMAHMYDIEIKVATKTDIIKAL